MDIGSTYIELLSNSMTSFPIKIESSMPNHSEAGCFSADTVAIVLIAACAPAMTKNSYGNLARLATKCSPLVQHLRHVRLLAWHSQSSHLSRFAFGISRSKLLHPSAAA